MKKNRSPPIWMLASNFPIAQDESRLSEGNKDVRKFQRLIDISTILKERVGIQESLRKVEFNHENDQRPHTTLKIIGIVGNGTKMRHQGDDDYKLKENYHLILALWRGHPKKHLAPKGQHSRS